MMLSFKKPIESQNSEAFSNRTTHYLITHINSLQSKKKKLISKLKATLNSENIKIPRLILKKGKILKMN